MSRPREYGDRTQTVLRIEPDLFARLKAAADEREVSANWLIVRAVERFLDDLLPVDQLILTNRDAAKFSAPFPLRDGADSPTVAADAAVGLSGPDASTHLGASGPGTNGGER